nr:FecR family protein [Pseudomonas sp. RIT-PI-AD]
MADEPIPAAILDEAAAWLAHRYSGEHGAVDERACAEWRQRSRQHALAWERAERLLERLGSLPPELSLPVLGRERQPDRRRALKQLAVLLGAAPVAWAAWREEPWRTWTADQRTAVGEQRELLLPGGTRLTLNTDTALDLHPLAADLRICLLRGEVLVETAPGSALPIRLTSAEGAVRASDARFSLRQEDGRTGFAVIAGALEIAPAQGAVVMLRGGQGGTFDRTGIGHRAEVDASAVAWTRGMLMADRMRLVDFAEEIARYHRGIVRCDPAIRDLRVSGAYPLRDRGRTLAMLQATYPVVASTHTGYWVTLSPA